MESEHDLQAIKNQWMRYFSVYIGTIFVKIEIQYLLISQYVLSNSAIIAVYLLFTYV
jgi:hypothetical protein